MKADSIQQRINSNSPKQNFEYRSLSHSLLRRGQKFTKRISSTRRLENAHDVLKNAMCSERKRIYNHVSEGIIITNSWNIDKRFKTLLSPSTIRDISLGRVETRMENNSSFDSTTDSLNNANDNFQELRDHSPVIRILKSKGKHWEKMGCSIDGNLYLFPEEALFMFERGLLRLWIYEGPNFEDQGKQFQIIESDIRAELYYKDLREKEEKRKRIQHVNESDIHDPLLYLSSVSENKELLNTPIQTQERNKDSIEFNFKPFKQIDSDLIRELKSQCRPLVSIQDAFSYFLLQNRYNHFTLNNYNVFRYLKQNGYTVLKHNPNHYKQPPLSSNNEFSNQGMNNFKFRNQKNLDFKLIQNLEEATTFRRKEMEIKQVQSTQASQQQRMKTNERFLLSSLNNGQNEVNQDIKESLQIVKEKEYKTLDLLNIPDRFRIVYDVWLPTTKHVKSKFHRPSPFCGVVVTTYDSPPPPLEVIHSYRQLGNIPIHIALLENGVVSFLNFNVGFQIPDLL